MNTRSTHPEPSDQADESVEPGDLGSRLDHAFIAMTEAPPPGFIRRVGARRRRVIITRTASAAALALAVGAAGFMLRGDRTPLPPQGPIAHTSQEREPAIPDDPIPPSPLYVIGGQSRGSTSAGDPGSLRGSDPSAAPNHERSGTPERFRIRVGDDLNSETLRALLSA